jgi:hypothetical protein
VPVRRGCPAIEGRIGDVRLEFLVSDVANSMITWISDGRPVVDESTWPQDVDLRPEKVAALPVMSLEPEERARLLSLFMEHAASWSIPRNGTQGGP